MPRKRFQEQLSRVQKLRSPSKPIKSFACLVHVPCSYSLDLSLLSDYETDSKRRSKTFNNVFSLIYIFRNKSVDVLLYPIMHSNISESSIYTGYAFFGAASSPRDNPNNSPFSIDYALNRSTRVTLT